MVIENKKISELKPAPYNPRLSDAKQEANLKASLEKFGVVEPIIFNKQTGFIVGGHFRVRELKKLGHKEVDCVIVDLSAEDERELNIRLNANTGAWDWEALAADWDRDELSGWGLELEGDAEVLEAEEDHFDCTPPAEPITVLGDLYEIGEHRLLCGDSTCSDTVARLMNGDKADMVFTDPPYGVSYQSNWRSNKSDIKFDVLKNDDDFLDIKPVLLLFSKENSSWYIWTSHRVYPIWREMFEDVYINTIIWDKGKMGMGDLTSYGNNYEMALFCSTGKPKLKGERKKTIWEINIDSGASYLHPTQKPVLLASYAIPDFTEIKDLILDLFLGSGSTMVASHQLNRKCYGMELDPKYCDVIVNRMKTLDPTLVIKRNGEVMESTMS